MPNTDPRIQKFKAQIKTKMEEIGRLFYDWGLECYKTRDTLQKETTQELYNYYEDKAFRCFYSAIGFQEANADAWRQLSRFFSAIGALDYAKICQQNVDKIPTSNAIEKLPQAASKLVPGLGVMPYHPYSTASLQAESYMSAEVMTSLLIKGIAFHDMRLNFAKMNFLEDESKIQLQSEANHMALLNFNTSIRYSPRNILVWKYLANCYQALKSEEGNQNADICLKNIQNILNNSPLISLPAIRLDQADMTDFTFPAIDFMVLARGKEIEPKPVLKLQAQTGSVFLTSCQSTISSNSNNSVLQTISPQLVKKLKDCLRSELKELAFDLKKLAQKHLEMANLDDIRINAEAKVLHNKMALIHAYWSMQLNKTDGSVWQILERCYSDLDDGLSDLERASKAELINICALNKKLQPNQSLIKLPPIAEQLALKDNLTLKKAMQVQLPHSPQAAIIHALQEALKNKLFGLAENHLFISYNHQIHSNSPNIFRLSREEQENISNLGLDQGLINLCLKEALKYFQILNTIEGPPKVCHLHYSRMAVLFYAKVSSDSSINANGLASLLKGAPADPEIMSFIKQHQINPPLEFCYLAAISLSYPFMKKFLQNAGFIYETELPIREEESKSPSELIPVMLSNTSQVQTPEGGLSSPALLFNNVRQKSLPSSSHQAEKIIHLANEGDTPPLSWPKNGSEVIDLSAEDETLTPALYSSEPEKLLQREREINESLTAEISILTERNASLLKEISLKEQRHIKEVARLNERLTSLEQKLKEKDDTISQLNRLKSDPSARERSEPAGKKTKLA